jgi:hypothetical protein
MVKPIDFQDSIMFGDEAAHIPTVKQGPKLTTISLMCSGERSPLACLWIEWSYALRRRLQHLSVPPAASHQFAGAAQPKATRLSAADSMAYDEFGLPKPE